MFRRDALDEIELDVEIANLAGGAAKFLEEPACLACELVVGGDIRKKPEDGELTFDAARRRTQTMHGPGLGIGKAKSDGRLKPSDVLAKRSDGMRRCGGAGHGDLDACGYKVKASGSAVFMVETIVPVVAADATKRMKSNLRDGILT